VKRENEKQVKTKAPENSGEAGDGREHLELLRSSRHFKHTIKKEKFAPLTKLDMMLTKLYLAL
jgi:hypothetical protein